MSHRSNESRLADSWQRVWRYCCRRHLPIPERTAPIASAGSNYSLSSRQRADLARAGVCWRLKPALQFVRKLFVSTPSQTRLHWAAFGGDGCFSPTPKIKRPLTPKMERSDSPAWSFPAGCAFYCRACVNKRFAGDWWSLATPLCGSCTWVALETGAKAGLGIGWPASFLQHASPRGATMLDRRADVGVCARSIYGKAAATAKV